MSDTTTTPRNLVVLVTTSPHDEKSTVAFTLANGGMTSGLKVSVFLTAEAVNIVRKKAIDSVHSHPFDPLHELVADFQRRGGMLWACNPCVTARGYEQSDLIDGVIVAGASGMHELIQAGAATLSF